MTPPATIPKLHAPKRRSTTNVDLGPLKEAVGARCAAEGVTASVWIREALLARLEGAGGPAAPVPEGREKVYRPWLDGERTAKLDLLVARSGRRSRASVLAALLDGVDVGAKADAGANLADAVSALARSNHELVAVGRNLNQVAKSLNAYPGRTTLADRTMIEHAVKKARQHLELAARLVAELRPQVKPVIAKGRSA